MLIAKKDYEPGDVILTEEPFIYMLGLDQRGQRCGSCFKKFNSLKTCSRCRFVRYCSEECKSKDWKAHHKYDECKVFKDVMNQGIPYLESALLYIRVYLILRRRPDLKDKRFELPDGNTKSFNDMLSNVDAVKTDPEHIEIVKSISKYLITILPDYNEDDFYEIYGKCFTNSFSICEPVLTSSYTSVKSHGKGIFMQYSHMNHSCKPNSNACSKGIQTQVRATTKIKSGEEITVSYVNPCLTRSERRMRLKRGWFFDCSCIRCRNNDDESLLQINRFFDSAIMPDYTFDGPGNRFICMQMYCDLIKGLLGEYCTNSAQPLVDLYCNGRRLYGSIFIRDRQMLDDILKRAEKVVLVNYGHDYPLYQRLLKYKETPYQY